MKRVLIGGLVVLALAIAWFLWRAPTDGALSGGSQMQAATDTGPLERAERTTGASDASYTSPLAQREELAAAGAIDETAPRTVTIRGRCIDAFTGDPLPSCKVELAASPGWPNRMESYLKDHEKVDWQDQAQITSTDGRFSFTCVPPPPYEFSLALTASDFTPGVVPLVIRWTTLEPGSDRDLGDIPMPRGSMVSGRIADSKGVPQGGVEIELFQYDGGLGGRPIVGKFDHRRNYRTVSEADGTFSFGVALASGSWHVRVHGRQKRAPDRLEIPAGQTATTLVVETRPADEVATITGVVVDQFDQPIASVAVRYWSVGSNGRAETDREGHFVVEHTDRTPVQPIRLEFERDGYERLRLGESHPWGTRDLKVVMQRCPGVDIVVTDGETGVPIEDYGVRCFPTPDTGQRTGDHRLLARGHHPEGRLRLDGIAQGERVLLVEPHGNTWENSKTVRFEMAAHGAPEQRVKLYRAVSQGLRVERRDGSPVAGTKVQLLQPISHAPVTATMNAIPATGLYQVAGIRAIILVMEGRTDADGGLLLRGSPQTSFVLRVLGDDHQPVIQPDVMLAAGAPPLIVTVLAGATLTGTIRPREFVEQLTLRGDAVFARRDASAEERRQMFERARPAVVLQRMHQGRLAKYPADGPRGAGMHLRDDGSFEVKGIPPGTWKLRLLYTIVSDDGNADRGDEVLDTLTDLEEGEVRRVDFDLAHLMLARLSAVVLLNGAPLEDADFSLLGADPSAPDYLRFGSDGPLGPGGTFTRLLRPAKYTLTIYHARRRDGLRFVPAAEPFELRPGEERRRVFDLHLGKLAVRVRGSDGQPLPGIKLDVSHADRKWAVQSPVTDEQGRTGLEFVLAGTLLLRTMPKRLTDPVTRAAFAKANKGVPDAWEKAKVLLGRFEVTAGDEPTEVDIAMPASSGY